MGIGSDLFEILTVLKEQGYLAGKRSVIEIGAQQLANSFFDSQAEIDKIGRLFGASALRARGHGPTRNIEKIVHGGLEHLAATAPFARDFWIWAGFEYASIDIDGSPGSIPLDLNYDSVPDAELGKYQLVTNFGTTEHVANQLNAFEVIHNLTAHGGVMFHQLPMQGMLNHGLVNYNPKFFWMLARSNGYKVVHFDVTGGSDIYYELPDNIVASVAPYRPDIAQRRHAMRVADMGLVVILQKVFDTPYVAPLDVPTGTTTDNKALTERYWSVLKPDAFANLERTMPIGATVTGRANTPNGAMMPRQSVVRRVWRRLRGAGSSGTESAI